MRPSRFERRTSEDGEATDLGDGRGAERLFVEAGEDGLEGLALQQLAHDDFLHLASQIFAKAKIENAIS